MAILKAPYNFVPLSQKVVYPVWADKISLDIPFADEKSGIITVKVEAVTPIYVRNGYKAIDKEQMPAFKRTEEFQSFSKSPDNVYFIPATTIKGELRHTLKIASFGKFNPINSKEYKVGKEGDRDVKKTMTQFVPLQHKRNDYDMAECIFGKVTKTDSLKGRVHISHAFCTEEKGFEPTIAPYMGSPKPTYYPIYLEQKGKEDAFGEVNTYRTYMGTSSKLRGWKMYPARNEWKNDFPSVNEKQLDNLNPSTPLAKGSQFLFTIRYHNLKKVELGALLYALCPAESSCHSIGFAKPFGYGVCKYTICYTESFTSEMADDAKREFVEYMEEQLHSEVDFEHSPQIKELVAMMNPDLGTEDMLLEYMSLEDYKAVKQHDPANDIYGQYLPPYSELVEFTLEQSDEKNQPDTEQPEAQEVITPPTPLPQVSDEILAKVTFSQKQGNNVIVSFVIEEGDKKGRKDKVNVPINVNTKNIKWNKLKQIKVEYKNGKYLFKKTL